MDLVSAESIRRPEVLRWHDRMVERYSPPPWAVLTVLLPCSARKPYSKSKSHREYIRSIRSGAKKLYGHIHQVIVTSPLGLVPRELEEVYPAAHYDVPVTGHWAEEERSYVEALIKDYQAKSSAMVISYGEGEYERIYRALGLSVASSLSDLEEMVRGGLEGRQNSREPVDRLWKIKAICDFQFGTGAADHFLKGGCRVRGYQIQDDEGSLLATMNRDFGYLALSMEGGRRLYHHGSYQVSLSFNPESANVFCAGIERADPQIRPQDEIIATYDGGIVGVGKSNLSGEELEKAQKGLGVTLRHRGREN